MPVALDYKLQNTTDSAYLEQMRGYKRIMEEKLHKPIICYFYSILKEKFVSISIDEKTLI